MLNLAEAYVCGYDFYKTKLKQIKCQERTLARREASECKLSQLNHE